jgi:hypothetical protein
LLLGTESGDFQRQVDQIMLLVEDRVIHLPGMSLLRSIEMLAASFYVFPTANYPFGWFKILNSTVLTCFRKGSTFMLEYFSGASRMYELIALAFGRPWNSRVGPERTRLDKNADEIANCFEKHLLTLKAKWPKPFWFTVFVLVVLALLCAHRMLLLLPGHPLPNSKTTGHFSVVAIYLLFAHAVFAHELMRDTLSWRDWLVRVRQAAVRGRPVRGSALASRRRAPQTPDN